MGADRQEEWTPPYVALEGKRVLVIKLRYIGDTLSIIPVIDNILDKAPGAEVDVMVNKGTEGVLSSHPGITRIWPYDRHLAKRNILSSLWYHLYLVKQLRARHYHVVIDFTHGDRAAFIAFLTGASFRLTNVNSTLLSRLLMNYFSYSKPSEMHIVDYQLDMLKILGMENFKRDLKVHIPPEIQQRTDRSLEDCRILPGEMIVAIHPGARGKLRQWLPERFAEIAQRLRSVYQTRVILLGGASEAELVDSVEGLMGFPAAFKSTSLSLLEMASVFSRCRIFIGNDSAPAHLAAAVGCPTVTLFGPTFPHNWKPLGSAGEVIFKNVSCCGCRQEGCLHPAKTCMGLIEVEEVWAAVQKVI